MRRLLSLCRRGLALAGLIGCLSLTLTACGTRPTGVSDDTDAFLSTLSVLPPAGDTEPAPPPVVSPTEKALVVLREVGLENAFFAGESAADPVDKALYTRNAVLEETYGISLADIATTDIVTRVQNDVLAGACPYDVLLLTPGPSAAPLIVSGCLTDLNALGTASPVTVGYAAWHEATSFMGKQFTVTGDGLSGALGAETVLLLDTDRYAASGLCESVGKSIYDITLDGHLTLALVRRYAAAAGSFTPSAADAYAFFMAGDTPLLAKDGVGEIPRSAFGEETVSVYEQVRALYEAPSEAPETSLFTVSTLADYVTRCEAGEAVAALPLPKLRDDQAAYACRVAMTAASCAAIPSRAADPTFSATCLTWLFSLSSDVYAAFRDKVASFYAPDDAAHDAAVLSAATAASLLDTLRESVAYDLVSFFGWGDFDAFLTSCVTHQTSSDAFRLRGAERVATAEKALSITMERLSSALPAS